MAEKRVSVRLAAVGGKQVRAELEGVGDADGAVIAVTPEGIDALLSLWPIFEAFNLLYVSRGMLLDAEKNGSAPSPTGTSAEAKAIARPATPSRRANAPAKIARPD